MLDELRKSVCFPHGVDEPWSGCFVCYVKAVGLLINMTNTSVSVLINMTNMGVINLLCLSCNSFVVTMSCSRGSSTSITNSCVINALSLLCNSCVMTVSCVPQTAV